MLAIRKEVILLHPLVYKTLLAIALTFLVLAVFAFIYLRPENPPFIVNIVGTLLLIVFILLITWEYRRQSAEVSLKSYEKY
ncbi:MAG TPA: hypothetical protein ENF75_05430 [Acidilobales archaeon]|nr:hypothetical protein [Acidilobales archaeon]